MEINGLEEQIEKFLNILCGLWGPESQKIAKIEAEIEKICPKTRQINIQNSKYFTFLQPYIVKTGHQGEKCLKYGQFFAHFRVLSEKWSILEKIHENLLMTLFLYLYNGMQCFPKIY